jgi:hypothetical protein
VDELLKLAIDGHGGARRWAQLSGFRAEVSVSGAIWDAAGQARENRQCRPATPVTLAAGDSGSRGDGYGVSSSLPAVPRPARSWCAWAALSSG